MVNAEISVIPIGTGSSSVSEYVAAAVSELEASGLRVTLTATGTSVEADSPGELFEALAGAQEAVFRQGAGRVYTILKMDDRRDETGRSQEDMVRSVRDSQED
ncbi:MTH1187 family thiamine-binding protein [Rubrobacter aplysinae]|uniref:MTH1187 family thiamine-binding protein n=1 Tax=Rubrobacter aplysinae TaxID=909625 RepID=UPI00064B9531|nr:MTH1187 family thiamine-binding protein [Rubrobacter aplysinae]